MQFSVPQFIETEDKIVGPLTLRQFFYLAVAGGLSLMLYFVTQTWLWFTLTLFLGALAAALAFGKMNGRPMSKVLLAGISFYWKPQKFVWQPENPALPKTPENLKKTEGAAEALTRMVSGLALKNTRRAVETGSRAPEEKARPRSETERYQIFRAKTGEARAAKRVDYR